MSYLNKISSNIPPKARIVLGITGLVSVVAIILVFKSFDFSGDEPSDVTLAGKGKIVSAPKEKDLPKPKPGDEKIIPDDSPIAEEIEKDRKKQIDKAKEEGGGFMDRLDFSNSKRILEKETGGNSADVQGLNSIDDELDSRAAVQRERERLAEERRQRALNRLTAEEKEAISQKIEKDHQRELDILAEELERARAGGDAVSGYAGSTSIAYVPNSSGYQSYIRPNKSGSLHGSKSPESSSRSDSGKSGNIADEYIVSKDRLPKVDINRLDSIRGMAGASGTLGGSGDENSGPYQGSGNTSYESIVNPVAGYSEPVGEYVNAGELHYAILQIGVNTDEIGPVRAIIPGSGKLHEGVLLGSPVRVGEKVSMKFDTLSVNGKDISVTAIALDPDTLRPALADGVDRHIFSRYFKLAAAAAAEGYVTALTGSRSRQFSDGSTESVIDRLPDADDQFAVALGSVGGALLPKFERDFDRPPTVEVNSNRDLIIMFMRGFEI